MALGRILREEREKRGLTLSQVAMATRMKIQVVEAIENEDFRRFSAALYGKGFIKIYAEFLNLDPKPLIEDYLVRANQPEVPVLQTFPKSSAHKYAAPAGPPPDSEVSFKTPPAAAKPAGAPELFTPAEDNLFTRASVPAAPEGGAPARKPMRPVEPLPAYKMPVMDREELETDNWQPKNPSSLQTAVVVILLIGAILFALSKCGGNTTPTTAITPEPVKTAPHTRQSVTTSVTLPPLFFTDKQ